MILEIIKYRFFLFFGSLVKVFSLVFEEVVLGKYVFFFGFGALIVEFFSGVIWVGCGGVFWVSRKVFVGVFY